MNVEYGFKSRPGHSHQLFRGSPKFNPNQTKGVRPLSFDWDWLVAGADSLDLVDVVGERH